MPKGLSKTKLSKLVPTETELSEARVHIHSLNSVQLNSKKTSCRHFLNSNPDLSMLPTAHETLLKFHVHVMRCKVSEKRFVSERQLVSARKLYKTLQWHSEEQLEIQYGSAPNVSSLPYSASDSLC